MSHYFDVQSVTKEYGDAMKAQFLEVHYTKDDSGADEYLKRRIESYTKL